MGRRYIPGQAISAAPGPPVGHHVLMERDEIRAGNSGRATRRGRRRVPRRHRRRVELPDRAPRRARDGHHGAGDDRGARPTRPDAAQCHDGVRGPGDGGPGRHRRDRLAARPFDLAGRARPRARPAPRPATRRWRCSARRVPASSSPTRHRPRCPPPHECPSFRDPPPPESRLGARPAHELLGSHRRPARERAPAVGAVRPDAPRNARRGTASTSRPCSTTAASIRSRS